MSNELPVPIVVTTPQAHGVIDVTPTYVQPVVVTGPVSVVQPIEIVQPISVTGTFFQAVQTIQTWPLHIKAEYSGANLLLYFADAQPGTASSAALWRIRKLTYDGNGNFMDLAWPNADTSFSYIWDNRAVYVYS